MREVSDWVWEVGSEWENAGCRKRMTRQREVFSHGQQLTDWWWWEWQWGRTATSPGGKKGTLGKYRSDTRQKWEWERQEWKQWRASAYPLNYIGLKKWCHPSLTSINSGKQNKAKKRDKINKLSQGTKAQLNKSGKFIFHNLIGCTEICSCFSICQPVPRFVSTFSSSLPPSPHHHPCFPVSSSLLTPLCSLLFLLM